MARFKFQDELNVLSAKLGSIQDTADALLLADVEQVERAILGGALTTSEANEITRALTEFLDDSELLEIFGIDLDEFDADVDRLDYALSLIGSIFGDDRTDFDRETIRLALAEGDINPRLLLEDGVTIFGDLTSNQLDTLIDHLADNPSSWNKALSLYVDDGLMIHDYDESAFWEWFRSEIYGD